VEVGAHAIVVSDETQVSEARRVAARCARAVGFDEEDTGKVALVATEIASNLLKHGGGGELIVRALDGPSVPMAGVELLGLDKGPGMLDVGLCVSDGYSTAGSQGIGLGAVARASATFDIYSRRGIGTVLLSRITAGRAARPGERPPNGFLHGAVNVPYPGEQECGDSWAFATSPQRALVLVADGLGHGPLAAKAARCARDVFLEHQALGPADIVSRMHDALRSTRGAAVAVTEIDVASGGVRHCGLGNVGAAIISGSGVRQLVSHNGSAGHEGRRIQEFTYPWPDDALFVMHSDGIMTRWRLDVYPGLERRHPGVIAGLLYRDARRERDDVTVFAMRVTA
jgi:anti-sigma regulatory factor (Ser/Thr protein kinase)